MLFVTEVLTKVDYEGESAYLQNRYKHGDDHNDMYYLVLCVQCNDFMNVILIW